MSTRSHCIQKRIRLGLLLLALSVSGLASAQLSCGSDEAASSDLVIATAFPVLASMVQVLTVDTPMETVYLPSPRFSIKRVPGWIQRQSVEQFGRANVVVGMTSVWPQIDVYPYLRAHNIGIIPIDAAYALVPGGERVAINDTADDGPGYFWLNPANALLMLGVIHRDLLAIVNQSCLSEQARDQAGTALKRNFDNTSQRLRQLQVDLDTRLSALGVFQVTVERPELAPLAQATLLPETPLSTAIDDGSPTLFITARKVGHKRLADLPEHLIRWHVDDFGRLHEKDFIARWARTIDGLTP
jgi:hypothetical protein